MRSSRKLRTRRRRSNSLRGSSDVSLREATCGLRRIEVVPVAQPADLMTTESVIFRTRGTASFKARQWSHTVGQPPCGFGGSDLMSWVPPAVSSACSAAAEARTRLAVSAEHQRPDLLVPLGAALHVASDVECEELEMDAMRFAARAQVPRSIDSSNSARNCWRLTWYIGLTAPCRRRGSRAAQLRRDGRHSLSPTMRASTERRLRA